MTLDDPIDRVLASGGELGRLIRVKDWTQTPLGRIAMWPESLRAVLGICLGSRIPSAICWGAELRMLYNDAWIPIAGAHHPWMLGRPAHEVWPVMSDALERVRASGSPAHSIELVRERHVDLTFTPINGAGVFATAVVLERERADAYALFEQAPVGIAVYEGPEHRVVVFNRALRDSLPAGVDPPRRGQPLAEALHELRGSDVIAIMDDVYLSGKPRVAREHPLPIREVSGALRERYFTSFFYPVHDEHGATTGVMVAGYEVTAELRLRRAAQDASRAKDEFLAMLGHELRNPLAPISTALELMRLRGLGSREQEVIERQVAHLTRLVDDLLDVSRITRGTIELRKDRFELAQVVLRALEVTSPLIEQRGQLIDCDVPAEGLPIDGDPDRLAQVVSNLVANASKYSDLGTTIEVRGERMDDRVVLRVRDHGIGIKPEMLERIFDAFVQQAQSLERSKGGLGLGLAIVRNLIELHGGEVRAYSDGPGQGSEFVVDLPLAAAAVQPAPARMVAAATERPASAHNRVLVVDDNIDSAEMISDWLVTLGFDVRTVHDGPSAIAVAHSFRPDICVLDIGLPVMDGYELARHLRASSDLPRDGKIIAVTGYGQDADRRRSMEAGFDVHLVKPIDLAVLARVIQA